MFPPQGRTSTRQRKRQQEPAPPPRGSLLHVSQVQHAALPLSSAFDWLVDLCGQVVRGGVYLLGGAPGANKSTLSRQIALDLAANGHRCLFILSEEPASRLKASVTRMMAGWPEGKVQRAMSNLMVESNVHDLEMLPRYFARNVLSPGGPYENTKLLVVDSIQGNGTAHTAMEKWRALHELGDLCRTSGVSTIWVSHLNKRGEYAGLRATEHAIDTALMLRKAGANRHIGVPKNRFGHEVHRLLPLEIDNATVTLRPSPHAAMTAAIAKSFLPGVGVVEVQTAVTLPKWGTPPRVMAPGLPRREIELLVACLAQVPGIDFDDLAATIQCRDWTDGRDLLRPHGDHEPRNPADRHASVH